MANTVWIAGDDVVQTMKDLVAKHHPRLALVVDEIAVIFREKGSEVEGKVQAGKTSKAPALVGILGDKPWKFVITLAADVWQELTPDHKLALLDHHLCSCGATEDEQTGAVKTFVRPPDVAFFKEELERHGAWRHGGAPPSTNLVADFFGK